MLTKRIFPGVWLGLVVIISAGDNFKAAVIDPSSIQYLSQPQSHLKPEDVVRIVIEALANNDFPFDDAGIATAFNFASPANKVTTGPLKRFISMVNQGYGLMLNHLSREYSDVVIKDSVAYQMVRLVARNGTEVVYAFRLSLQTEGEYRGMWMTDAVWEVSSRESY